MKHDEFFRRHPVFTGEELAMHLSAHGEVGTRAQEATLAYYRKTGRVVRVRRGLYAVIPAGADPDSYPVDPFLIAATLLLFGPTMGEPFTFFLLKINDLSGFDSVRCGSKSPQILFITAVTD